MLNLIENLPVELLGMNVLGYLFIKDIVMLEQACGSKKSQHCFLELLLHRPPVVLPSSKHRDILAFEWFRKRRCRIKSLEITLPWNNPGLHVKNIKVDELDLHLQPNITMESCESLFENDIFSKVRSVNIKGTQNREVMEQLSACTGNVKQLTISSSSNCMNWITVDILSRWKLSGIKLTSTVITTPLILCIVQTCSELASIELDCSTVNDSTVKAIAQHTLNLELLKLSPACFITYNSLIALSEHKLPLKELVIPCIPYIPTAGIAYRCSHALSCIRELNIIYLVLNAPHTSILLPYMAELTSVVLDYSNDPYLPLLTQYCHKLTTVAVNDDGLPVTAILALCLANPLLQELLCYYRISIKNPALVELIHACPHLHTLRLSYETDITDIGILAVSEHCPQLQCLDIGRCQQITEAVVLHLLHRCRKLTTLEVSSSSLSEETWTQLDSNIQKRVSRCIYY